MALDPTTNFVAVCVKAALDLFIFLGPLSLNTVRNAVMLNQKISHTEFESCVSYFA